jgi:DNA polymerase-3 subunit alpha
MLFKTYFTMRVLIFDTETNGLPRSWNASPYKTENWPIILTLAWQLWEVGAETPPKFLEKDSYLFAPSESVIWDNEAETIHGISRDRALAHGVSKATALPEFVKIVRSVDLIVAHNMAFDKTVLLCELIRLDSRFVMDWWPRFEYCTCEGTKTLCALPPAGGKRINPKDPYKKPKLVELYRFLFPGNIADFPFHSAEGDTECLTQCFLELVRRRHVPLELWSRGLVRA